MQPSPPPRAPRRAFAPGSDGLSAVDALARLRFGDADARAVAAVLCGVALTLPAPAAPAPRELGTCRGFVRSLGPTRGAGACKYGAACRYAHALFAPPSAAAAVAEVEASRELARASVGCEGGRRARPLSLPPPHRIMRAVRYR